MKVYIVEDTDSHYENLSRHLHESAQEYTLIGRARSVESAIVEIPELNPELLFLDIEIQGGTVFDVLPQIDTSQMQIIFTTAREEFALQAFKWAALDYLLKPINQEDLELALGRVQKEMNQTGIQIELLQSLLKKKRDRIALHTQHEIHIVAIEEILRCEADGNYSTIYLTSGKKILVTKTLKEYDKMLSEDGFLRVHQSHLVSVMHIQSYIKTDGGYLKMKDGSKVPVSTRRQSAVIRALG